MLSSNDRLKCNELRNGRNVESILVRICFFYGHLKIKV